MVGMAAVKAGERSVGSRALSAVAGLAFLGYGIYLGFIFDGGGYMMFFQAFILPVGLLINFIRSVVAKPEAPQPYLGYPAPPYQGDPAQGQPYPGGHAQQQSPYAGGATQPYPGQPQPGPTQPGPTQPS